LNFIQEFRKRRKEYSAKREKKLMELSKKKDQTGGVRYPLEGKPYCTVSD